jgi:hypothetical protein
VTRQRWIVSCLAGPALALLAGLPAGAQVPLGAEFQVSSYPTSNQTRPSVATDASGAFVVVWQSLAQDGSDRGVFGRRFDAAGAPQGGEFQVNLYTTSFQANPDVATDGTGGFVVVWESYGQDGASGGVFGRRYDAAGTAAGGEFAVNAYTTFDQSGPSVARDPTGSFVVVWTSSQQDGASLGIIGRRYDAAGAPQGMEFVVNSYTSSLEDMPSVAAGPSGSFVAAWRSVLQDLSGGGVFAQRFDGAGTALGAEFRANSFTPGDQIEPAVAVDASGGFVVVWKSYGQDGDGDGIFAQRYDATGAVQGGEFQVNSYVTSNQSYPSVALDASGGFVVVWQSLGSDGGSYGIAGRSFDSTGTALGDEFQVNSYTTASQYCPSVAIDRVTGRFVVAWASNGQDASTTGIFGRRFAPDRIFADGFE